MQPNADIYFSKLCACTAANNGVYDPRCQVCSYGYVYSKEPDENLLVIRTAMKLNAMHEKLAMLYSGGARITIFKYDNDNKIVKAHSRVTHGDVIVIKNDIRRDRDFCVYGEKDSLWAFNVTQVLSVTTVNRAKTELIEYKEGEDYEVVQNGATTGIKWLEDGRHPEKFYAVEFISSINYWVWEDMSKPRGSSDGDLPKVLFCRLRPYYNPEKSPLLDIPTDYPDPFPKQAGTKNQTEHTIE